MGSPLIAIEQNVDPGYLKVKDVTEYPIVAAERSDVFVAQFWSTDAFAADFKHDFTNPAEGQWNIAATTGETYNLKSITFYQWESGVDVDFAQTSVVGSNGELYIKVTASTKNPHDGDTAPHLDAVNWSKLAVGVPYTPTGIAALTEENIYDLCVAASVAGQYAGDTTAVTVYSVPLFNLYKYECHLFKLEQTSSYTIVETKLYAHDGTELAELSWSGNSCDVDIDEYGDGVYYVGLIYTDSNSTDITLQFPIYDMCDAYDCYTALFKYNLCKCGDPCDQCDDDLTARKYDEDSIRILVEQIERMVYLDKYQYIGVYAIDTTRQDLIDEISNMIDKLHIITDRCGLCDELESNAIDC